MTGKPAIGHTGAVLPSASGGDAAETRLSDRDRDAVVALLRESCTEGRLTLDELSDRIGAVYEARTRADLQPVLADLPTPRVMAPPRVDGGTTWVIGVMSGPVRRGRWRPGAQVNAFAWWGGCKIDLREAELPGPSVDISAAAIMGGIEIIVPRGIRVEVSGIPFMGGIDDRVDHVAERPGQPVIRVRAFAMWGSVVVRHPSRKKGSGATGAAPAGTPVGAPTEAFTPGPPDALGGVPPVPLLGTAPAGRAPEGRAPSMPPASPAPAVRDGTVTILFTDIEGSTRFVERLGDVRAGEVMRTHNAIVRGQLAACGGREIGCQGDGFAATFESARRALRCAIGIEHAVSSWSHEHLDEPLRVRIGVHTGEALDQDGDLFGTSVIVAARIAAQAEGGQILVSGLVKELVDSSGEFRFGPAERVTLRGLTRDYTVHPVAWSDDTADGP